MSKTNTGGPAFPAGERFEGVDGWHTEPGMTLRDYFAAKAMQCMGELMTKPYSNLDSTAEIAYKMADAMLKARES
jgi:hypothetical protein